MSGREPTYVEREQQRLTTLLPGWRTWAVGMTAGGTSWHAMPAGAETVACNAHSPDELVTACKAWDACAYIAETAADLAATPDDLLRKREMLTANLLAARRVRDGQRLAGAAKP